MTLSAGTVSMGVSPDTKGFGAMLHRGIMGQSGAIGATGKVLGGLVLGGLAAGLAGIGAVIHTGFGEAMDASAGTAQLAAGIKSTGDAAHVSVQGLNALASSIQGYSGQTDDSIVKSEQLLLTFTNIKNSGPDKIFDMATVATADMAAKMGGDASGAAIQLGKALNDPVKGITALSRVGVSFTQGQKDSIAAMVKSGDTIGAQKVILKELNAEFGGAAKAAGQSLPGQLAIAKRAFEDVSQSVVEGLLPVVLPAITSIGSVITTKVIPAIGGFVTGFKAGTGAGGTFHGILTRIGGALKTVGGFLTSSIIPGLKVFFSFVNGNDTGVDGPFRSMAVAGTALRGVLVSVVSFVRAELVPAVRAFGQAVVLPDLKALGAFLTGTVIPAVKQFATAIVFPGLVAVGAFLVGTLIPGLLSFGTTLNDNKKVIGVIAGIIGAVLIPHLIALGVKAVISAAQQVASWAATKASAVSSSIAHVAATYKIIGGWIAAGAAALKSGAETVYVWALYKAEAIKGAATTVASHARMAAAWVASAVRAGISAAATAAAWVGGAIATSAAWVLSTAKTIAALAAQGIAMLASRAVMVAVAIGTGIWTAAQWLLNAAMTANPIGIVIVAIAALVAGIIWVATKTTWFQTIFHVASRVIGAAWTWVKTFTIAAWNAIVSKLTTVWNWIKTAVSLYFNAYKTIISTVWTTIKNAVGAAWGFIKSALTTAWTTIKTAVTTAFNAYVTIISTAWTTITTAIPAAWAAVKTAISTAWDTIKTAVSTKAGELVTFVGGIPAKIVTALGTLTTLLTQKGKDVVQGLWDGMTAIWNKVTGWIGGIATWIKDHKGPLSLDAKLLTPHGKVIMQGFWDGLKSGFSRVQSGVGGMAGAISSGVSQWLPIVQQALSMLGQPLSLAPIVLRRMNQESGGNPRAINLTDSNAQRGDPSRGLMQTIGSTFAAYMLPGLSGDIFDPLSNIVASMRYALANYGSLAAAYNRAGGYDTGGMLNPGAAGVNYGRLPERVLSGTQTQAFERLVATLERGGAAVGSHSNSDVVSAIKTLGDRFADELQSQARTIQMMQRQMAGAR